MSMQNFCYATLYKLCMHIKKMENIYLEKENYRWIINFKIFMFLLNSWRQLRFKFPFETCCAFQVTTCVSYMQNLLYSAGILYVFCEKQNNFMTKVN